MRFTANAALVKDAIKAVKPSMAPLGTALTIEARGKSVVEVGSWNADLWISVKIPEAVVDEPGRIALDYKAASRAVCAVPGEVFEVSVIDLPRLKHGSKDAPDRQALSVVAGEDIEIHVVAAPMYAPPTEPLRGPTGAPSIELHVGALAEVGRFADQHPFRPILNCVAVQGSTYVATDSYRLGLVEVPEFDTGMENFLIPLSTVEMLDRMFSGKTVTAKVGEKEIMVEHGDVRLLSRLAEGEFPNWKPLVPEQSTQPNTVEVEGIYEVARTLWRLCRAVDFGWNSAPAKVTKDGNRVLFEAKSDSGNLVRVRANGKIEGIEGVGFNPEFLCGFFEGTNVDTMFGISTMQPWGVHEDAEYCFGATRTRIIMPVRLA
jgi:DNA polymerase III sliding clamp (beta) subunit (PCNA family)